MKIKTNVDLELRSKTIIIKRMKMLYSLCPQFVHRQSNVECLCAIVLIDRNCVLSTVEFVHFVGKPRRINNAELIIVCVAECRLRRQQSPTIVPALHFDTLNETNEKKATTTNSSKWDKVEWRSRHQLDIGIHFAFCAQGIYIVSSESHKKWIYGALTVQLQCLNYVPPTLAVVVDWGHVHTAAAPAFFFSVVDLVGFNRFDRLTASI